MEIKLPTEKPPYSGDEGPRKALRLESLRSVVLEQPPPFALNLDAEAVSELEKESQKKALSRTVELLSIFGRELKYEVMEDAGVVQIQVIDAADGRVIRKIPADEVIKLIEAMKEKIDDRVDVLA
ncbi:MAG: flagellar protein FlaG [Synergistaceae bacterium]|jgi:hypothetical protein|nr:flagellar protein FlaG [Synergistaceae bacterium]